MHSKWSTKRNMRLLNICWISPSKIVKTPQNTSIREPEFTISSRSSNNQLKIVTRWSIWSRHWSMRLRCLKLSVSQSRDLLKKQLSCSSSFSRTQISKWCILELGLDIILKIWFGLKGNWEKVDRAVYSNARLTTRVMPSSTLTKNILALLKMNSPLS